jgi:hypothetical protein
MHLVSERLRVRLLVLLSLLPIAAFGGACSVRLATGELTGTVTLAGLDPQPPLTVTVSGPVTAATTTTASGAYTFAALPIGEYQVTVKERYTVEGSASVATHVTMGASSAPPLRLTPYGTLSGRATLAGLDPQPPLTVTLSGPVVVTTVADPVGGYAFGALPVGEYALTVAEPSSVEGSATATVHVTMGPIAAPELQLTPLGTISGAVVLAGLDPHAGLSVSYVGPTSGAGATDDAGRYRFGPLPVGTYVVTVIEPYSLEGSASTTVDVSLGATTAADLQLVPTGRVSGNVALTRTPPRAGLPVTLRTSLGGAAALAWTDTAGRYGLGPVVLGTYIVSASAPSTAESTLAAPVTVAFGMNTAPDLLFTALGGIEGTVTLAGGGSAASAAVWAQGTNRAALTSGSGAFELPALPVGSYVVSASRAGSQTSATLLDVAYDTTTSSSFVLSPSDPGQPGAGRMSGYASVLGLGRRDGITVSVDATPSSTVSDAGGSWTIAGVPDGVWSVTLTDGVRTEHVPAVLALPGSEGFLLDGVLYPIGEIELQNAPRLTTRTMPPRQLTSDGHLLVLDGTDLLSAPLGGGPVVRISADVLRIQIPSAATGPHSWVAVFGTNGTVSAVRASGGPAISIASLTLVEFDSTGEVLLGRGQDDRLWYAALERGDIRPVAQGWTRGAALPAYFRFTDSTTGDEGTVEYATGKVSMWGARWACQEQSAAGGRLVVWETGPGLCYGRVLVGDPGAALTPVAPASDKLYNMGLSVSPDGRFVAVSSFDLTTGRGGLILASTTDGTVLWSDPDALFLAWSPDSAHFTWRHYRGTGDLNLAVSADGSSRQLSSYGLGVSRNGGLFSPDGAYIAFNDETGATVVSNTSDGATVADVRGVSEPFGFSPDSRFLATRGASLQSVSLVDGSVTFVSSVLYLTSPQLSPDGQRLLFFSDDGLSSAPLSGAPVTRLVPGTKIGGTSFLPPTNAVLFESFDGFHLVPIDGGTIQDLGTRGPSFYSAPSTSVDGLSIAHLDGTGVLRSAALPAGAPSVVDSSVSSYQRTESGLVIRRVDSSLSVAPPTGTATPVGTGVTSWSIAPGGWVLFTDDAKRLISAVVPTGVTSLLAPDVPNSTWLGGAIRGDRVALESGGILQSVAVSGGPLTPHVRMEPALWYPWTWLDDRHGIAVRTNAPPPYRFQNGLYLVTVP